MQACKDKKYELQIRHLSQTGVVFLQEKNFIFEDFGLFNSEDHIHAGKLHATFLYQ